jgi:hypothetical protein
MNSISQGSDDISTAAATINLGYGPFQTAPPRLLNLTGVASQTINLPPINTIPAAPPGTPGPVTGCCDGFLLTIRVTTAAVAPTINPNGSDTIDAATLTGAGSTATFMASGPDKKWYKIG